jgi:hypothetical protein
MGIKSGSGSGMNNPDHISESLEIIFLVTILKFFDEDPGSRMEKTRNRDSGWKKFVSGINILDPQHWYNIRIFLVYLCEDFAVLKILVYVECAKERFQ